MEPFADLILANRAFVDHEAPRGAGGAPAGVGGLLAVVRPVVAPWDGQRGTVWIGAGRGAHDREYVDERGFEEIETPRGPLRHRRLFFDEATWDGHYRRASNSFLWPLVHLSERPLPDETGYFPRPETPCDREWDAYREVNGRFAEAAAEETGAATCWVHDYQLSLAPRMLRERGFRGRIGFFLHTPMPDIGIALRYLEQQGRERCQEVVSGMLGADLVGLQSGRDASRFLDVARRLGCGEVTSEGVVVDGRTVTVGPYPVGIDVDEVLREGSASAPPAEAMEMRRGGLPLVVGLERADYTKGIPERLRAIAQAYRGGARFAYAGYASPTRVGVPAYQRFGEVVAEAEREARQAADDAGCPFFQKSEALPWSEVLALQREADVVFTSSLADGMNLVPLQAAAVQGVRPAAERGVVICSVGAGVSWAYGQYQGEGFVFVDSLDGDAMCRVLVEALEGKPGRVSDGLTGRIRELDARHWATRYLSDLVGQQS